MRGERHRARATRGALRASPRNGRGRHRPRRPPHGGQGTCPSRETGRAHAAPADRREPPLRARTPARRTQARMLRPSARCPRLRELGRTPARPGRASQAPTRRDRRSTSVAVMTRPRVGVRPRPRSAASPFEERRNRALHLDRWRKGTARPSRSPHLSFPREAVEQRLRRGEPRLRLPPLGDDDLLAGGRPVKPRREVLAQLTDTGRFRPRTR